MNLVIRKLHEAQLRKDLPEFRPGDTVKVKRAACKKAKAKRSRNVSNF